MTRSIVDIEAVFQKLTLDEKIQLLAGIDMWRTVSYPEKGLPYVKVTDGPNGARGGADVLDSTVTAALFPAPAAVGATWDVEMATLMGKGIAQDSRSKKAHVSLAPTINIQRDPRGGRSFESYSEDPILTGDIGAAWIEGCQGQGVLATPKHFIANECENKRRHASSEVEEAPLREIYLRPFQRAIRNLRQKGLAEPGCIMTSYNRLNGISCSEDERLLKGILREEWGYDGMVVSDWYGTYSVNGIKAGLDLEMPGPTLHRSIEQVYEAIKAGKVSEADIDARVHRVLQLVSKVDQQLLANDPPLDFCATPAEENEVGLQNDEISASIRKIATEAMIVLRNNGNLLPLEPTKAGGQKKIAFIGHPAVEAIQSGGGSANLSPQYRTPPLDGFKDVLKELGSAADDVEVMYAEGCQFHTTPPPATAEVLGHEKIKLEWYSGISKVGENDVPFTVTELDTVSWNQHTDLPEGIQAPYVVRVSYTLTPTTTGHHTISLQAYGKAVVKVGEDIWQYASEEDPQEYFVAMDRNRRNKQFTLEGGKPNLIVMDYTSFIEDDLVTAARHMTFRMGFEEYYDDEKKLNEAIEVAKNADVAVVFVGTGSEYESEGYDRDDIKLPRLQNELIVAIAAAQPNTVVVNLTGSAVEMPWIDDVPAVLQAWFPGQECGRAIADALLGLGSGGGPSGRIPSVWPKKIEDHPSYGNFPGHWESEERGIVVYYKEGLFGGHKWYEEKQIEPLFWLGYGLSYTTWERELVSVEGALTPEGGRVTVNVRVQNTGSRVGKDVIQIYVKPTNAAGRPKRALVAFTKVTLQPGEAKTVSLVLDQEAVSYWNEGQKGHWKVDKGSYEIVLANSASPRDEVASHTINVDQEWTWNGVGLPN
ncbi:glycoside hydrolase superfamily [Umbelopsis sp. PMI_123]|nr:glycoside hydrolase superfamily [Umbelopsis sp. PMI_123]